MTAFPLHAATYTLPSGLAGSPFSGCSWDAGTTTLTCSGTITIGNNHTVNITTSMTISISGTLDVGTGTDIVVSSGSTAAFVVGGTINLGNNTNSNAEMQAGGTINTGTNAVVTGNLTAGGTVNVGNNGIVNGNVTGGGGVNVGTNGAVNGSCTPSNASCLGTPIGEWRMDETSWNGTANEVKDSSGKGNHGTAAIANGSTPLPTTASVTTAYSSGGASTCRYGQFDSTSGTVRTYTHVALSNMPALPTSFTFTAWIRSTNGSAQHQRILVRDDADNGWGLSLADGTNTPQLRFFNRNIKNSGSVTGQGNDPNCGVFCLDTNSLITSNAWYFIAAAINTSGKTVTLYVYDSGSNKIAKTSSAFSGTWKDGTGTAAIGGETAASSEGRQTSWHFLGNIDEVLIYSGALTQTQIESLMTRVRSCSTSSAVSFAVTPSSTTASSCAVAGGTPAAPYVTITAMSGASGTGSVVTSYTSTVTLSSYGSGTWSKKTGSGTLSGNTYTFIAADNGTVDLYLTDGIAESVTPIATAGTITGTSSSVIAFSDNTLVVSDGDTKNSTITPDYTIVAGRNHAVTAALWNKDATTGTCSINTSYTNASVATKLWLTATTGTPGTHPAGAPLPKASLSSACTSKVTLTTSSPGATNINLGFASGQSTFYLCSTDVGQYVVKESSTVLPGSGGTATSNTFTAVPFAITVTGVKQGTTNNPVATTATGTIFAKAGSAFEATVAGYPWTSAADTNNDGLPDANVTSDKISATALASYVQTITLAAATPITPTPGGTLGAMSNAVAVTSGTGTTTTLAYPEVGSFTLTATPSSNYLGATSLSSRVLIYANSSSTAQTAVVGRFTPFTFRSTTTQGCSTGGFTYSGQPFSTTVSAINKNGDATRNYTGAFAKAITLGYDDGTCTLSTTPNFSGNTLASGAFSYDAATLTQSATAAAIKYTQTPPVAPVTGSLCARDSDGVVSVNVNSLDVRNGRLRLSNVFGATSPLKMPIEAQYWTGKSWIKNSDDACTTGTPLPFTLNPTGWTISGVPSKLTGGEGLITVTPSSKGQMTVSADLTTAPWLKSKWGGSAGYDVDPSATANFGIYSPEYKNTVHIRELY